MTSQRHKSRPAGRTDDDAVLDAARSCVLAVGVRRTTLTDIARRAGVSRMTLYRRWPDVRTIVGDLMTRELIAVADAVAPAPDEVGRGWLVASKHEEVGRGRPEEVGRAWLVGSRQVGKDQAGSRQVGGNRAGREHEGGSIRARLVESLVTGTRVVRAHPLMRKIVEVDPELLLPYVLDRRGASQEAFLTSFESTLRAGHRDGSVRPGHPALQARALLLIVQSFALSARTMTDEAEPALSDEAFDAELRHILDRTLAP